MCKYFEVIAGDFPHDFPKANNEQAISSLVWIFCDVTLNFALIPLLLISKIWHVVREYWDVNTEGGHSLGSMLVGYVIQPKTEWGKLLYEIVWMGMILLWVGLDGLWRFHSALLLRLWACYAVNPWFQTNGLLWATLLFETNAKACAVKQTLGPTCLPIALMGPNFH